MWKKPTWSYPGVYNSSDPLAEDFYKPHTWYVFGKEVHRSRFLTLLSREVPDMLKPAYSFGGISMSQLCSRRWGAQPPDRLEDAALAPARLLDTLVTLVTGVPRVTALPRPPQRPVTKVTTVTRITTGTRVTPSFYKKN